MKPSAVLLKAAEHIDFDLRTEWPGPVGCCFAIGMADNGRSKGNPMQYLDLFAPENALEDGVVRRSFYWFGDTLDPKNQETRVLALLFAHQVAKSEQK